MPELPEVETVVRELRQAVTGKHIKSLELLWHKSFQNMIADPPEGRRIDAVNRHGKYIIFHLDSSFLVGHLRMTGQFLFCKRAPVTDSKHLRVKIQFTDRTALHFIDQRKFGRIYQVRNPEDVIGHIGVDALDPKLDEKKFSRFLRESGSGIKAWLLSQKYISGVGNIYADESLYQSKIHPAAICKKIPVHKRIALFHNLQNILQTAVMNMGTTISDYRDINGLEGNNQQFLNVYGKSGRPCSICTTVINKRKIAGRGAHYCPKCQKKY